MSVAADRLLPDHLKKREDERLIRDWQAQVDELGTPPRLMAFDLSRMRTPDWGYRFFISVEGDIEQSSFIIYGSKFARLLGLPEKPEPLPMMPQLPERYRAVFAKGCDDALRDLVPVRLGGVFDLSDGQREAYRAAFAPVILGKEKPTLLVFGSFGLRLMRPRFRPQPKPRA